MAFPNSPTTNQIYKKHIWDGESWSKIDSLSWQAVHPGFDNSNTGATNYDPATEYEITERSSFSTINGNHYGNFDPSNGFTTPTDGEYAVNFFVSYDYGDGSAEDVELGIFINGVFENYLAQEMELKNSSATDIPEIFGFSTVVNLNQDDRINAGFSGAGTGGNPTIKIRKAEFSGHLI